MWITDGGDSSSQAGAEPSCHEDVYTFDVVPAVTLHLHRWLCRSTAANQQHASFCLHHTEHHVGRGAGVGDGPPVAQSCDLNYGYMIFVPLQRTGIFASN